MAPRRPFVHHSKRRTGPRWLSAPNLVFLAVCAGVGSLYLMAFFSSTNSQGANAPAAASADGGSTTTTSSGGMLAAAVVGGGSSGKKAGGGLQQPLEAELDPPFHVVFSTSCSPFQDWQALLLFFTAEMVGQKVRPSAGRSGCVGKG